MTEPHPALIETEDGGREQCWPLPTDERSLLDLIRLCFNEYWDEIWFGILIEVPLGRSRRRTRPSASPATTGMRPSTSAAGTSTCASASIGKADPNSAGSAGARAELYRRIGIDDHPTSWGVRLHNGRDEQMMTILLPNPFLTNVQQLREQPAWEQLELWNRLRATFLGLEPDPLDRAGKGFQHG